MIQRIVAEIGGVIINTIDNELNWRITLSLTKEQEESVLRIRQMKEYRRLSFAEIIRSLIDAGLESKGFPKKEAEHD